MCELISPHSPNDSPLCAPSQIGKVLLIPQRQIDTFSFLGSSFPASSIIIKSPVMASGPRGFSVITQGALLSSLNDSMIDCLIEVI